MSNYDTMTIREVIDDYVLVRGDLTEEYARQQLADHVQGRTSPGDVMGCDSCPIEFDPTRFAVMVADGWRMGHTFQAAEYNRGRVIACSGHFSLRRPRPEVGAALLVQSTFPPSQDQEAGA